ncbi:MAG: hypothetical protein JXR96_24995 [Deltaproteobacteria bacterium]|nr:hypothetical protein [Deltaproteobacteria bacterium]
MDETHKPVRRLARLLRWALCSSLCLVTLTACLDRKRLKHSQQFSVATEPREAKVWIEDASGKRSVGSSPVRIEQEYEIEERTFNHHWWWLTAGCGLGSALGLGLTWGLDSRGGEADFGLTVGFSAGVAMVVTGVLFAVWECMTGEHPVESPVYVGAGLEGYADARKAVSLPLETPEIHFLLSRASRDADPGTIAAAPSPAGSPSSGVIIAVFDVHDASNKVDASVLRQLTSYLSTAMTRTGRYKVVPRDQLRKRLLEQKGSTYKACMDESCQIELGKALSAQKSLAVQLLKVGKKCAVTANLYDLKTETTEKGALVNTGCKLEELLDAMQEVARQLTAG